MPTYHEIRGSKCYFDLSLERNVKSGSFFKILPSATIVSVRYLTPKAIGIFKVFLDISYANLLHPWLKLAQTATVFYLYLHLE